MPKGIYIRTLEGNKHISEAKRGKPIKSYPKSKEHRERLSIALKGNIPWNKGKQECYSMEARQKISRTLKEKNIQPCPEAIAKAARLNSERERSTEHRHNLSLALKGQYIPPEVRLRMSLAHKGVPLSEHHRNSIVQSWIRWTKSRKLEPNKAEQLLYEILQQVCPDEYKYTGNGEFSIGGFIPDFVNANGKKKVIEMYGDYWHRNDNPQDRIDKFAEYGFSCLVVWERELKEQSQEVLLGRIRSFNNA